MILDYTGMVVYQFLKTRVQLEKIKKKLQR